MATTSSRFDWLLFLGLGGIWGSSYLFIKIGVDAGLPPFTLVMVRLLIGFLFLTGVVGVARESLPRDPRMYGHLVVLGILSMALPFCLITVAERSVDSTLASTLAAAIPLVVVPIAAIVLPGERLSRIKVAGVAIGFVGVAALVGFDPATLAGRDLPAELALGGATVSYAIGGVYARKMIHGLRPMIPALFQVGFALVVVTALAFAFERPFEATFRPEAILAVVWLGLLGSGVAYLAFFGLLERWGATRTSMVAYLLPIIGIALGATVLGEPVEPTLVVGAAFILVGIVLVNRRGTIHLPRITGRRAEEPIRRPV